MWTSHSFEIPTLAAAIHVNMSSRQKATPVSGHLRSVQHICCMCVEMCVKIPKGKPPLPEVGSEVTAAAALGEMFLITHNWVPNWVECPKAGGRQMMCPLYKIPMEQSWDFFFFLNTFRAIGVYFHGFRYICYMLWCALVQTRERQMGRKCHSKPMQQIRPSHVPVMSDKLIPHDITDFDNVFHLLILYASVLTTPEAELNAIII